MARMYPALGDDDFERLTRIHQHTPASRERDVYFKLKTSLSDEYIVMYSYNLFGVNDRRTDSREIDFLVYHRDKGILCVELKASELQCDERNWKQRNRRTGEWIPIANPWSKAQSYASTLFRGNGSRRGGNDAERFSCIKDWADARGRAVHCPVGYAVWLLEMPSSDFIARYRSCPEVSVEQTLFAEDYSQSSLDEAFERIFNEAVTRTYAPARLDRASEDSLLNNVLCPKYGHTTLLQATSDRNLREFRRFQLYEDQMRVLDYLEYETRAAVWGVGGSGKTVLAIRLAKKLARMLEGDERILFLCFNERLREYLELQFQDEAAVEVLQPSGLSSVFGCKTVNQLNDYLDAYDDPEKFPYRHLLVDEFQDFGVRNKEGDRRYSELIERLMALIECREGRTYIFYDDRQVVTYSDLPSALEQFHCRLPLFSMVRNTEEIARCALAGIGTSKEVSFRETVSSGKVPLLLQASAAASSNWRNDIKKCIKHLKERGIKEEDLQKGSVQILTCLGKESFMRKYGIKADERHELKIGAYAIAWETVRRYKGLDTEAVILMDVDKSVWYPSQKSETGDEERIQPGTLFYLGASRAISDLCIIASVSGDDCGAIIQKVKELEFAKTHRDMKAFKFEPLSEQAGLMQLAEALHCEALE